MSVHLRYRWRYHRQDICPKRIQELENNLFAKIGEIPKIYLPLILYAVPYDKTISSPSTTEIQRHTERCKEWVSNLPISIDITRGEPSSIDVMYGL